MTQQQEYFAAPNKEAIEILKWEKIVEDKINLLRDIIKNNPRAQISDYIVEIPDVAMKSIAKKREMRLGEPLTGFGFLWLMIIEHGGHLKLHLHGEVK